MIDFSELDNLIITQNELQDWFYYRLILIDNKITLSKQNLIWTSDRSMFDYFHERLDNLGIDYSEIKYEKTGITSLIPKRYIHERTYKYNDVFSFYSKKNIIPRYNCTIYTCYLDIIYCIILLDTKKKFRHDHRIYIEKISEKKNINMN